MRPHGVRRAFSFDRHKGAIVPALLGSQIHLDFPKQPMHFAGLFELVLALHAIPLDRPQVEEFRALLKPEEQSKARASRAGRGQS